MKISPTLTEVKEIAKTGKYDILPVSCEILSDFITPIEAMRILQTAFTTDGEVIRSIPFSAYSSIPNPL